MTSEVIEESGGGGPGSVSNEDIFKLKCQIGSLIKQFSDMTPILPAPEMYSQDFTHTFSVSGSDNGKALGVCVVVIDTKGNRTGRADTVRFSAP
jgi:hypothetical protein